MTDNGIIQCLSSPNVPDQNGGPGNVVDVIDNVSRAIEKLSGSITVGGAGEGRDAAGGSISCLTESVMGITAGLFAIAEAINNLADATRGDDA